MYGKIVSGSGIAVVFHPIRVDRLYEMDWAFIACHRSQRRSSTGSFGLRRADGACRPAQASSTACEQSQGRGRIRTSRGSTARVTCHLYRLVLQWGPIGPLPLLKSEAKEALYLMVTSLNHAISYLIITCTPVVRLLQLGLLRDRPFLVLALAVDPTFLLDPLVQPAQSTSM